jgi:hypothetical protein
VGTATIIVVTIMAASMAITIVIVASPVVTSIMGCSQSTGKCPEGRPMVMNLFRIVALFLPFGMFCLGKAGN